MLKTDVKRHFGSLEAIAQAIGVSKAAISQWPEIVPQGAAYKLQVRTRGRLKVNPALYPRLTRPKAPKAVAT